MALSAYEKLSEQELAAVASGVNGFQILATGNLSESGSFGALLAIEDTTLDDGCVSEVGDDLPEDLVIPAGLTIVGRFSDVVIKSGTLLAYNL